MLKFLGVAMMKIYDDNHEYTLKDDIPGHEKLMDDIRALIKAYDDANTVEIEAAFKRIDDLEKTLYHIRAIKKEIP